MNRHYTDPKNHPTWFNNSWGSLSDVTTVTSQYTGDRVYIDVPYKEVTSFNWRDVVSLWRVGGKMRDHEAHYSNKPKGKMEELSSVYHK